MHTFLSMIVSFILTLVADVFVLIPFFNPLVGNIMNGNLIVSQLDYQVILVIMVIIMSTPLFALLFAAIDALSTITFKARSGY